jgi:hypothetical protein
VEFSEIIVSDEAIVLPAEPASRFHELRKAVRNAIGCVIGHGQVPEDAERYRPHVSVAYITRQGQPLRTSTL